VHSPLLDSHPLFPPLAAHLRANPGRLEETDGEPARAAVAIVLRAAESPGHDSGRTDHESNPEATFTAAALELLLILRADHPRDPWSGQVALPGGRRNVSDATLQDTAVRETLEETGIDLAHDGVVLGTLDELRPRTPVLPPIIVTPFVAIAPPDLGLTISDELADAFWAPWSIFADPTITDERTISVRGSDWKVASYLVGERIVWGMTERMLRQLAQVISSLRSSV
jgi:8-oxo-dGTP pyrophosphatase MutT (NUDIX family)